MFRVKTTRRNVKRATSPLRPATDISGVVQLGQPSQPQITIQTSPAKEASFDKNLNNYFEAESASVLLSKPWLRLERGIRLQKFRTFANAYPGLTLDEKENLYRTLMKANDSKLLNTKQQINYENGIILSVKGLKIIKTGNPLEQAIFKIEITRPTKKNIAEDSSESPKVSKDI